MAVDQQQRADALNNAIVLTFTDNELDTIDDMALIGKVTGAIMLKVPHIFGDLDSIYINGERLTDTLDEAQRQDPKVYADALRIALRPYNNFFVTVKPKSEAVSSMRAIIYENENISPGESATNEQKIEAAINFAADFKDKAIQKQKDDVLNNAVKVSLSNNDTDLIKSVTGVEDINASNKREVLDSIYINGKNLSDILGEDKENNIEEYAKAVREALDINNNSFITVMKKNTLFSKPRAVIPENNYTSPEEQALAQKKTEASVDFAASYRENINKKLKEAKAKIDNRVKEDQKLFFSSLFGEDDDFSNGYARAVADKFDGIIPGFLIQRNPQAMVYAYMLTLDYPEGSGNKLTMDQIQRDDSEEMKAFKVKAGKDFCRIFRKRPENDTQYANDAEYYNAVTYPTLIKMTDAVMHIKVNYYDLKEPDSIENAVFDNEKRLIAFDLNQQAQHANIPLIARENGVFTFGTYYYGRRFAYLESDSFLNDTLYSNRNNDASLLT